MQTTTWALLLFIGFSGIYKSASAAKLVSATSPEKVQDGVTYETAPLFEEDVINEQEEALSLEENLQEEEYDEPDKKMIDDEPSIKARRDPYNRNE